MGACARVCGHVAVLQLAVALLLQRRPLALALAFQCGAWDDGASWMGTAANEFQGAQNCKPTRDAQRADAIMAAAAASKWSQKSVVVPAKKRGCHLITPFIVKQIGEDLAGFKCGLAHLFLQHTSASLTINENYDSDVLADTETFLNDIVPEGKKAPWRHTMEGPDDMPAHIKSSMFGCSVTVPITNGQLNLGTWQGIWLCEHRDHGTPRKVVITLQGA